MNHWILGLSAYYHDSAAVLVKDGQIVAAAQEERFTRKKADSSFPSRSIEACLKQVGIQPNEIAYVVFYDKPLLKFERLIETYMQFAPRGLRSFATAMPVWIKEKLFLKSELVRGLKHFSPEVNWGQKILFSEHHLSHAASAFYPSPFNEALILTMDGVGEWTTTSVAIGRHEKIEILKEIHFPHSLGLLYSAITGYLGFKVNSGEYKVMGLAPYGEPKYEKLMLDHLIDLKPDGSFRLNLKYFDYCTGLKMFRPELADLFGQPPRSAEGQLTQFHMDMAASLQQVTELAILRMGRALAKETGQKNLCLAGGVALNCVANGKLLRDGCFDRIWVQPAAGDAGGALGAALVGSHLYASIPRVHQEDSDGMAGAYLGPAYSDEHIESELRRLGAQYEQMSSEDLIAFTADALASGQAVGWFQGRMEFGPRSLGARSILADARSPHMQSQLNLKIKYRESFRPFAPSVLREDVMDWFEFNDDSPYMLMVADVKKSRRNAMTAEQELLFGIEKLNIPRSEIPAITHVDGSARLQTVHINTNSLYHKLLSVFKQKTGCPVLVNTSFNVRGEPIVCTPEDAYRCFMGTELDLLVIGSFILKKTDQLNRKLLYKDEFELD